MTKTDFCAESYTTQPKLIYLTASPRPWPVKGVENRDEMSSSICLDLAQGSVKVRPSMNFSSNPVFTDQVSLLVFDTYFI